MSGQLTKLDGECQVNGMGEPAGDWLAKLPLPPDKVWGNLVNSSWEVEASIRFRVCSEWENLGQGVKDTI